MTSIRLLTLLFVIIKSFSGSSLHGKGVKDNIHQRHLRNEVSHNNNGILVMDKRHFNKHDISNTPMNVHILHHIWIGSEMDAGKRGRVQAWGDRLVPDGWQVWMWHANSVMTDIPNVIRKAITKEAINCDRDTYGEAWEVYMKAGQYSGVSDIIRYHILYKFGGVYIDVDVGPGRTTANDLDPMRGRLPITFGPQLRNFEVVRQELGITDNTHIPTLDEIITAAGNRQLSGAFGNHFIQVPTARSEALKYLMIDMKIKLRGLLDSNDLADLPAFGVTGQGAIAQFIVYGNVKFILDDALQAQREAGTYPEKDTTISIAVDYEQFVFGDGVTSSGLVTGIPAEWVSD